MLAQGETMRIGQGFDVHRFVEGRPLMIGGVEIPFEKGLKGHSDADVLLHAICDALLGAAGCGDIGQHFPDTDPAYKGISSLRLLEAVGALLRDKGFRPVSLDATLIGEKPKIAAYVPDMKRNIAEALSMDSTRVQVKGTTTEGLGFTGREEGLGALAVALLEE
jgi:2-C-methyl-D-erythritol 2,4-cyclodiphosphate synthase